MSAQTSPRRTATRRIKPWEAQAGIYVDFEGRKAGDPVLLGILFNANRDGTGPWVIEQFVMDPEMQAVDEAAGATCTALSIEEAVASVIDRSDAEGRHLISWSQHDRDIMKRISDNRAFRYRNAIRTAKGWRYREETPGTSRTVHRTTTRGETHCAATRRSSATNGRTSHTTSVIRFDTSVD